MKILMVLVFAFISTQSFAKSKEVETENLVCFFDTNSSNFNTSVSCVSKVSIEKDALEKAVLFLQKEKLELELAKLRSTPDKKGNKK